MKHRVCLALAAFTFFLGACATPQQAVQLSQEALGPQTGRVGVAMTKLPKVDTYFPGAGCLLCIAAARTANSRLTNHVRTLSYGDIPELKNEIAKLLDKKGLQTYVIEEELDIAALPDFSATGTNIARKDLRSLRDKYGVDKLIVVETAGLGVMRTYYGYGATSGPIALFEGLGYMVNLKDNQYEWFLPVIVHKVVADEAWKQPQYPAVTDTYFKALKDARETILDPFISD